MIAIIQSAWVVPGLVGPALAGYVAQESSWRWTFLALAPLLPLAALAVAGPMNRLGRPPLDVERSSGKARSLLYSVQLAVGAALLLAALGAGHMLFGAAALLGGGALTVMAMRRLLPAGTLSAQPGPAAAIAMLGLISVAFFGVEAFVPLAVSSLRGAGTLVGGLALTAAAVTWAAGSWVQARLANRASRRVLTAAGVVLIAAGIGIEAAVPVTALAPTWLAALGWAVSGLGMGIAFSTATLSVIENAAPGTEGAASSSVQLAEALGIGLGTGIAGAVVAMSAATSIGLAPGIATADLLMLVACGLALAVVPRTPEARRGGGLDSA